MNKRGFLFVVAMLAACGGPKQTPVGPGSSKPPDVVGDSGKQPDAKPAMPPAEPALALWPEVKRGTLPNGLTYYILKHKKPEKRAFLWLAVNSGSVQEDDDQRGLAHFVEHMAFNGTSRFPKNELVAYLEKIGMRFGADLNAYTNFDQTVYQLEVPTDDKQFIDKGFDILHDWGSALSFDPGEVDKERGVVLGEWRIGRGANQRLFDKHVKVLFKGSRYAERNTIGLSETLEKAPRDTLVRFYKDWYRPDLMAVIAVGDFDDSAAIEKQIVAKFGDFKNPDKERPRPRGEVPKADGTRVSIETDREQTTQGVTVYNMFPHRAESTASDFRRSILENVYRDIINERLRSLARKKDAPFTGAFAGISGVTREIDGFTRGAQVKNGKVEDAMRALFGEVIRIEKHGVTQGELDRARTRIARRVEQSAADAATDSSTNYTNELTRVFLEHEFMIGRDAERDFTVKTLPQITIAELNALAASFGGAENRVIVISGPDGKPLPTKERVLAIIDEVSKAPTEPWVDKPPPTALMAQTPKPGTITKETKNDKVGVTEWTLSNGIRVIVKPSDFEADAVHLAGISPGGLATAGNAQYPNARFADDIASIGGAGDLDVEDLGKVLAGKQASASTSINEVTESVGGRASSKDLETMFQLVYLKISAPRKDEDQIAVWRANTVEQLTNRMRSPDYQFGLKSGEVLWKGNARRKLPQPADIEKLDADKALAFYKDRFGDAGDFTFVIVGTVDLAKLKPLVETYLASLPSKGRKEKEKDLGIRRAGGKVVKSWTLGEEQAKANVSFTYHGDEAWSRDKDRDMLILSRVLSIRMREILREDLGGTYGARASGSLSRSPHQERSFTIGFAADPKRVDELITAAKAEIAKIAKEGIGTDVLDKVKKTFERERETSLRNNMFWLGWLESAYRFGDDPTLILDPAPTIARMTSDNVKASAKRYLDDKQYYQAVMLPAKIDGTTAPTTPLKQPSKQPPKQPPKDPKQVPGAEKTQ